MASPIFISNPSNPFSLLIFLRSLQLTILSFYKSLINPNLYSYQNVQIFIKSLKLSLLFYILLDGPIYASKCIIYVLNYFDLIEGVGFIDSLQYFMKHCVNLNVFIISLYSFIDDDFETLFKNNLQLTNEEFYNNYQKLPVYQEKNIVQLLLNFNHYRQFLLFIKRYLNYYSINVVIYLLISYPTKYSPLVISFIIYQNFANKIGHFSTILLLIFLYASDNKSTLLIVNYFNGSQNLIQDFLISFFNRINFNPVEQKQWFITRNGVLFGIGFFYFCLINNLSLFSFIIYTNGLLNMGYLITKLSNPLPDQNLSTWCITESVWNDQAKILNGDFLIDFI